MREKITVDNTVKTTDYITNFVYRNDTLQYMLTGQGRTTISPADNISNEEFFVKDHLGNIRSIVDAKEYNLRKLNLVKWKLKLSLRKRYFVKWKLKLSLWKLYLVKWKLKLSLRKLYLVKRKSKLSLRKVYPPLCETFSFAVFIYCLRQ